MTSNLKVSTHEAQEIASELFNVQGITTELPGEIDYNFKIKTPSSHCYILKISRLNENENYLHFQQALLQHIESATTDLIAPIIIKDKEGQAVSSIIDASGNKRFVRLLTWISGRIWSAVNPQLDDLRFSLGVQSGLLTKALDGFDHTEAQRQFVWDIAQSVWVKEHIHLFSEEETQIISKFIAQFEAFQESYSHLRKSVVHNDLNDNNIIVSDDLAHPKVVAAIDYGDAIYTQIINDVAIACAYAIMQHNDPLEAALPIVKGYHSAFPLEAIELDHLYTLIAMRLVISVTKSAINKVEEPHNAYLFISEQPAWEVLKTWHLINPEYACYSFRDACDFSAHPNQEPFKHWAKGSDFSISNLFPTVYKDAIHHLDLSVSSTWIGHKNQFNDLDFFQLNINKLQQDAPDAIIAGGYCEPRPLYTATSFDKIGNEGRESRTMHLGVDFWLPAQTPIHALLDGEVVTSINNAGDKLYGGLVILKHKTDSFEFFTLYGHLSIASVSRLIVGSVIAKGDLIGELGKPSENGHWAPHLHFQIMLSMLDYENDFPGVAYLNQITIWKSLCPDPNLLFKFKALEKKTHTSNDALIGYRQQHLGKSLSLQYKTPIQMVRGAGQYLMDPFGKKYLDTVNNVAHVGHEHYAIVQAGQEQMALINTNSRYLHQNINALAKELIDTLPPELNVLHFVNSGSEAIELAIRMVKACTGERDMIASEFGYHGNSNMCIDISSYKFDGKGGKGAPEHTQIFPLPDAFRGLYRGSDTANKYAAEVQKQIDSIHKKGRGLGGFIIEPIISCGGQIELPDGFLSKVYTKIRNAGGLCISDEVQTGCGRMGKTFWGFQLHDVIPDIVTIGKPLGNGHPVAAVACTQAVAEKFANGMEFFNTFGGNPVSCAIATEVLRVVKREKLQKNALEIGTYLKAQLLGLSQEFSVIGDVRGQGLFLGIELVDADMNPLAEHASYLVNRMKDHGILMSTDGPDHNVLKIKPPLVFNKENADELLFYLKKICSEDFMTSY